MKKTIQLLLGVLLFPLAAAAQSMPQADKAFAEGDFTSARNQYESILKTATGEDRLKAQLRLAASQYGLGEYRNAAETMFGYELPENSIWKARFLLYRIQMADQTQWIYAPLMNDAEILSDNNAPTSDMSRWTRDQWKNQIEQDYQTLWALRADLINAPIEKEGLIVNLQDTDTRRIPTLFDFVVQAWTQRLERAELKPVPLARKDVRSYLGGTAKTNAQTADQADLLSNILETASLLDGKGRQNAKIFWKTDFILLPLNSPRFFITQDKAKAVQEAAAELNLLSGYTPQKAGFWHKIKGYVSPEETDYGRSYAAYQLAQLLEENDQPEESLKICDFAAGLEPSFYTESCQALKANILQNELSLHAQQSTVNPAKAELAFTARNAEKIYVRLYKTSFEELKKFYQSNRASRTINSWDFLQYVSDNHILSLLGRVPYKKFSTAVTYKKPYRAQEVSFPLPELTSGFYIALSSYDTNFNPKTAPVQGAILNATDLALFVTAAIEGDPADYTLTLNSKKQTYRPDLFRVYTVNAKTGQPEGNVKLDMITEWKGTHETAATQENGSLTLRRDITVEQERDNSHFINVLAEKDGHFAATPNSVYFHFYNNSPVHLYAQTDRAIYRPGQKVYLSVNAFETLPRGLKTLGGKRVEITVSGPSGQDIFKASPILNEMGTAQAEFTLPQDAMLGYFSWTAALASDKKRHHTYASFEVEDFKRPDYEITLNQPEKALEYDKSGVISGHAQYYFGTPLQEAEVKYTVKRQEYVPPFYWWWTRMAYGKTEQVAEGSARTDDKGNFKIEFTPAKTEQDEQFAQYVVQAEVYDDSGRPITVSKTYNISAKPQLFKVDFNQGFYDANTVAALAQIDLTDADGKSVSGKVTVEAARLENVQPQAKTGSEEEFYNPRFFPRPSLESLYENAKEETVAFTRELNFKSPGAQTLDTPALPAGVYRLTVKNDKADKQQMIFVVADDKTALALPDVTLAQHNKYYPGSTARFLIGAGNLTGSKRVELYQGRTFLLHKELLPGFATLYSLPVTQEMRGGFELSWFGASNYVFHQGSQFVNVPFDNKELTVTIDAPEFVRPGQSVAWKLHAKDATGSPVMGQASVTVYDKSLDYYAKKENPFTLENLFPQTTPDASNGNSNAVSNPSTYFRPSDKDAGLQLLRPELPSLNLLMSRRMYGGMGMTRGIMPMMAKQAAFSAGISNKNIAFDSANMERGELEETMSAPLGLSSATGLEAAPQSAGQEKIAPRTDFSETAYFNPALPLVNGQASVRFTLPQSLTAWNILGFVLTKNVDFGTFTANTITRKDFMVRLQMPRFYREADKGSFQAALTNLTNKKLTAEVEISLKKDNADAQAAFGLEKTKKTVTVGPNATQFVTWNITAPANPALYSVTVTARSGKNSDGEQKTFPVLPGKERLLATVNTALKNGTNTLKLTELDGVKDAKVQTAALTINPSLALSVLNSMPNVLSAPNKDLVSSLNRYVPLAVVNAFYTSYPQLKEAVKKLPKRTGRTASWNENDPLRMTLLEQTPWLRQAQGRQAKEADIVDLFNAQIVSERQKKEMKQIATFQNASGAFTWFPGGQDDDYLTLYALSSFAQALSYGAEIPQEAAQKAFSYILPRIEKRLKDDKDGSELTVSYALYAAYTLSAFPANWEQAAKAKPYIKRWADYADQQSRFMTALGQTYAAAVYHRLGDDVKANRYLDLVLSRMKQDDLSGAYFAPEAQSWIWYQDTLTTQTATLRTILELRPQSDKIDAMTQWILFNRQVNDWTDSKAAAQAVFTLMDVMKHKGALSLPSEYAISWGDEKKELSFEPFDWTEDLQFVRQGEAVTPAFYTAQIDKKGVLTDFASLSVLYETANAKASAKGVINVTRQYFVRFTQDGTAKLRPVTDLGEVKIADEVEVHLTVDTQSAFEYVLLSDPKPAGFESAELLSGWTSNPLPLYRENRDAATQFFINWLPAGTVTLRYILRPTVEGRFHALPAQAQSMYAPEFGAHTESAVINVEK